MFVLSFTACSISDLVNISDSPSGEHCIQIRGIIMKSMLEVSGK